MLLGDDVIDLETGRRVRLRQAAILAAVARAPADEIRKGIVHDAQEALLRYFFKAHRALE
jgi:hypothetical protein